MEHAINTIEKTSTPNRKDVHDEVTKTIIQQLEKGTIPWAQSWKSKMPLGLPYNGVTGNHYRGINIVLLWSAAIGNVYSSNEWASYRQWGGKGEYIRKGEKGNLIVYADSFEKEVDGEIKKIPFLKHSVVFNRCQLASYNPDEQPGSEQPKSLVEKIDAVEDFVFNVRANIEHHAGDAFYNYAQDKIYMPVASSFIDTAHCTATENYYSVYLHELTHWTGHQSRLDRKIKNKFGDAAYAEEELVAELGSAFLTAEFGITAPEKPDHAAYIANWLKVLKDNKQFVISAASEASKAVEYMRELQPLKFNL